MKKSLFFHIVELIHLSLTQKRFRAFESQQKKEHRSSRYNSITIPLAFLKTSRLSVKREECSSKTNTKNRQFAIKPSSKFKKVQKPPRDLFNPYKTSSSLSCRVTESPFREYLLFLSCLEQIDCQELMSAAADHCISVISLDDKETDQENIDWISNKCEERHFQIDRVIRYLS